MYMYMDLVDILTVPPPTGEHEVQLYSHPVSSGQHCLPPKPDHLYSQSSCANKTSMTSDLQHPKYLISTYICICILHVRIYSIEGGESRERKREREREREREMNYPLCSTVLILNPKVGEIVLMSSPINFFKMVVFPALSRPL